MKTWLVITFVLIGSVAQAQAPTLQATLEKAKETERLALVELQKTGPYLLFKAASEARQQLEAVIKAQPAK
jgi:hypothetical protein